MTMQTHRAAAASSSSGADNQQQQSQAHLQHAQARESELLDAVRVSLKHADSLPEDEEHYVSEDGVVVVTPVDDKSRVRKYKRLLGERERELQQAAEYGIGLLDKNEELQLQLAALQIQHEAEVEALAAERDTVKRHHDHALLEVENWKRRFTRIEEDKSVLVTDFERFAAHCTCRAATGSSASDHVAELTHKVAELELALQQMEAAEHASAVTIAQLRAWKRAMEHEQEATHAMELAEAQRERAFADKVAVEHVKLQKRVEQLTAANDELRAFVDAQAEELRAKKRSTQELLDDLAELRLECSAKTEQLLTAEARGSRLQRELALLEDVSYLARAVIDRDAEDDDSDDSECADESSSGDLQHERKPRSNSSSSSSSSNRKSVVRESLSATDAREGLMPSPFTAFPASVRAANGKPVAVTPSDLESHKKLHHYFHLTAQSIIHENKLHDKCFRSSSRFTLDSWYREIIASDVPYLEWHAWLINRISHVAASVADDSDASASTPDASRHPRPFGGFFLRRDAESSSSSPVSTPAAAAAEASPSHRPRHVPFSVARAFFRLLRGRQTRETSTDSSSEE